MHETEVPPVPDEAVILMGGGAGEGPRAALGSDPFAETNDFDPFIEGLHALGADLALRPRRRTRTRLVDPLEFESDPEEAAARAYAERARRDVRGSSEPTPLSRRRRSHAPRLDEVEIPDATSLVDRLLGPDERRRLAALAHMVEGNGGYDRFGLSPDTLKKAFPVIYALYKAYFRVQSLGHENLPSTGGAILAGNHGGILPFDGAMVIMDTMLNTDPPRLPRAIVDRWAGSLPWVNVFYARVGQVIGTRENFADLLRDDQLLLVFPEGMDGVRKNITQRYRLQSFKVGFVEQALLGRSPIVPVAIIGSDNQAPILYDVKPLAKLLGLPMAPITPTFPWLGPLGLLPYPVNYKIVYGEPLNFHERYGPDAAGDVRLVRYLAQQVRRAVQLLVDRNQ
jgi:1-acyl-sn-glycerol-3-phosphate acyltransferase